MGSSGLLLWRTQRTSSLAKGSSERITGTQTKVILNAIGESIGVAGDG
jgi:hypothetical protein